MTYDKEFLAELDQQRHKEIYARIIALTFQETPVEQIEGRVTAGSINVDGASAVQRTCSLSMIAKEVNINEFYWGLSNKFQLEVGVKNTINPAYPDIIWFKQGIFIITQFNTSLSSNNYTISISGKDKMCLLNGEIGGSLPSSVDFGAMDTVDTIYTRIRFTDEHEYVANKYYICVDGDYILDIEKYDAAKAYYKKEQVTKTEKIPLYTIIKEAVHKYAKEPYHNIVISDLDKYGLELLEYRGNTPLFMLHDGYTYTNMTANSKQECYIVTGYEDAIKSLRDDSNLTYEEKVNNIKLLGTKTTLGGGEIIFNNTVEDFNSNADSVMFLTDQQLGIYTVIKVEYGQTAGYRTTSLTYAGDLIANVGESLVSVLDKIKNMLGDFEYFYDVNGRFIFQKKRTYVNTSWNTIVAIDNGDSYVDPAATSSSSIYSFIDNNLISAFNNNPQLTNLKNDYSVWGVRKTATGAEIPIHARIAIDKKPEFYHSLKENKIFVTEPNDALPQAHVRDWRELIYQMAVDYYAYSNATYDDKKYIESIDTKALLNKIYYLRQKDSQTGKLTYTPATVIAGDPLDSRVTYYEQIVGDEFLSYVIKYNTDLYANNLGLVELRQFYPTGVTGYEQYYEDLQGFWRQLYDVDPEVSFDAVGGYWEEVQVPSENGDGTFRWEYQWIPYQEKQYNINCDYYLSRDMASQNCGEDILKIVAVEENQPTLQANISSDLYWSVENGVVFDGFEIWRASSRYGNYTKIYTIYKQDGEQYPATTWNNKQDHSVTYYYKIRGFKTLNDVKHYSQYSNVACIVTEATFITVYPDDSQHSYSSFTIGLSINTARQLTWQYNYEDKPAGFEVWWSESLLGPYHQYTDKSGFELLENGQNGVIVPEQQKRYYVVRGYHPYYYTRNGVTNMFHRYTHDSDFIIGIQTTDDDNSAYCQKITSMTAAVTNITIYQPLDENRPKYDDVVYTDSEGNVIIAPQLTSYQTFKVTVHNYAHEDTDYTSSTDLEFYKANFNDEYRYWNKNVVTAPEMLNFWFDFLDCEGDLAQFAVPVVGDRSKVVNDTNVTAIYFRETPNIIYTNSTDYSNQLSELKTGYTYIYLNPSMENLFTISAQRKSAKMRLDELLYQHSYCVENVSITTIPIYYLEPNTRIFVHDDKSKIDGEYIVSKFTIPLAYNGTMSITASKAVDRLY